MDTIQWLGNILKQCEAFTISEAISKYKEPFDTLCIVNYLISDIIDLTRNELETEQDVLYFNELIEIKDKILKIKNANL